MALYLDVSARNTLLQASSKIFGYDKLSNPPAYNGITPYAIGTAATASTVGSGTTAFNFTAAVVKDAVETLATKNIPRLGETYVAFVHPHQSRWLRSDPEFIEVTKYAAPGNFMLGEIGRINDVVFIETTQVNKVATGATGTAYNGGSATTKDVYEAIFIGDNAFGHAISLPVELRDGGILDFGREHALAWYSIWGLGLITDASVLLSATN